MHKFLVWFVIFIIFLTGCGTQTATSATPAPVVAALTSQPTLTSSAALMTPTTKKEREHLLVAVTGDVQILLTPDGPAFTASQGLLLPSTALLQVPSDATAVILCDSLEAKRAIAGVETPLDSMCPQLAEQPKLRSGLPVSNSRGSAQNTPFIVSPRSTNLLAPPARVHWNTTQPPYTLTIKDIAQTQTIVRETDIQSNTLVLKPNLPWHTGVDYLIEVVDANGGSSDSEGMVSLLADEDAMRVQKNVKTLNANLAQEVSNDALLQARALVLIAERLYDSAIELLEPLSHSTNQPMTRFMLAECYRLTGRYDLAFVKYKLARSVVRDREKLARALIAFGAGENARIMRQNDEARVEFDEAHSIFAELKQDQSLKQVNDAAALLPKP